LPNLKREKSEPPPAVQRQGRSEKDWVKGLLVDPKIGRKKLRGSERVGGPDSRGTGGCRVRIAKKSNAQTRTGSPPIIGVKKSKKTWPT